MPLRRFRVRAYINAGNTERAEAELEATTPHAAARTLAETRMGGAHIYDGRMETGGVIGLWSFAAVGFGQRVWAQEIFPES